MPPHDEQLHMPRALVGTRVVTEAVVDHPSASGLACPGDWVQPAVGEMLAQNRSVGIGVEVAIALVEDGEVGQTTHDRMSVGAYDDGGKILLRIHCATSYPNVRRVSATIRT
jgi:hypothetical protein